MSSWLAASPPRWRKQTRFERRGRGELEPVVRGDPRRELLGERDVAPHVVAQPLDAVVPDHEPELERTKPPAERDVPVAVIDHGARLRRLVQKILGEDAQRLDQRVSVGDVEAVAVEVREHPLVRVETVAVGVARVRRGCAGTRGKPPPFPTSPRRRGARSRARGRSSRSRGAGRSRSRKSSRRWRRRRTGRAPRAGRSRSPSARASARIANVPSVSIRRRLRLPIPAIFTPFSIDEWAWVDA